MTILAMVLQHPVVAHCEDGDDGWADTFSFGLFSCFTKSTSLIAVVSWIGSLVLKVRTVAVVSWGDLDTSTSLGLLLVLLDGVDLFEAGLHVLLDLLNARKPAAIGSHQTDPVGRRGLRPVAENVVSDRLERAHDIALLGIVQRHRDQHRAVVLADSDDRQLAEDSALRQTPKNKLSLFIIFLVHGLLAVLREKTSLDVVAGVDAAARQQQQVLALEAGVAPDPRLQGAVRHQVCTLRYHHLDRACTCTARRKTLDRFSECRRKT